MSAYLWGLLTLPAIAVGGFVLSWLASTAVSAAVRLGLGFTAHRLRQPDGAASLVYGSRTVRVIALRGDVAVMFLRGFDPEAQCWARTALSRRLSVTDVREGRRFPQRDSETSEGEEG